MAKQPARTPGRFEVQVRVDAEVLRGERSGYGPDALCELGDGTPLEPEAARRIACDAALVLYTTDEDGTLLDMGRRRRTITPSLARALWKRDGGCVWPGCCCVLFLHGHHLVHWADGGETKLENLVLVCSRHHPAVHEGGRRIERNSDGSLSFYDSLGREVKNRPLLPEVPGRLFEGLQITAPRRSRKTAPASVPPQVWSDSLAALRSLELRARFGDAHAAYARAVGGLLPRPYLPR